MEKVKILMWDNKQKRNVDVTGELVEPFRELTPEQRKTFIQFLQDNHFYRLAGAFRIVEADIKKGE